MLSNPNDAPVYTFPYMSIYFRRQPSIWKQLRQPKQPKYKCTYHNSRNIPQRCAVLPQCGQNKQYSIFPLCWRSFQCFHSLCHQKPWLGLGTWLVSSWSVEDVCVHVSHHRLISFFLCTGNGLNSRVWLRITRSCCCQQNYTKDFFLKIRSRFHALTLV